MKLPELQKVAEKYQIDTQHASARTGKMINKTKRHLDNKNQDYKFIMILHAHKMYNFSALKDQQEFYHLQDQLYLALNLNFNIMCNLV